MLLRGGPSDGTTRAQKKGAARSFKSLPKAAPRPCASFSLAELKAGDSPVGYSLSGLLASLRLRLSRWMDVYVDARIEMPCRCIIMDVCSSTRGSDRVCFRQSGENEKKSKQQRSTRYRYYSRIIAMSSGQYAARCRSIDHLSLKCLSFSHQIDMHVQMRTKGGGRCALAIHETQRPGPPHLCRL